MKAIVHIGSPKTGSSSIQAFLHHNAAEIARRGVRFQRNVPDRGSQFEYPLAALAIQGAMIPSKDGRVRYKARTVEEARANYAGYAETLKSYPKRFDEPVALFSSEHFLPWIHDESLVQQVDRMFGDVFDEVRYVVYLRRQEDLLVSQYSEQVKRGANVPLDQFIGRRLKAVNHFRVISRWANVVGHERMDVRLLERDFLRDGDLITDFCHACGFSPEGLQLPPRENESITVTAAEVMRHLNLRIPEVLPTTGANPLRRGLLEHVTALTDGDPAIRLNPHQKARVHNHVAQGNERLRAAFFPDRPALFADRDGQEPPMPRYEVQEKALDVLTEVLIRLRTGDIPGLSQRELNRSTTINDDIFPHATRGEIVSDQAGPGLLFRKAAHKAGHKFRNLSNLRRLRHGSPR